MISKFIKSLKSVGDDFSDINIFNQLYSESHESISSIGTILTDSTKTTIISHSDMESLNILGGISVANKNQAVRFNDSMEMPIESKTNSIGYAGPIITRIQHRVMPFNSHAFTEGDSESMEAMQPDRVLGPFSDESNRFHWFDIFSSLTGSIGLMYSPSLQPVIFLPSNIEILNSQSEYTFSKGSIWIKAALLSVDAPSDAYCGLRVKKGKLKLDSPAAVVGRNIQINPGVHGILELELDPPIGEGPTPGPGIDASQCHVGLPLIVRFEIGSKKIVLSSSDQGSLEMYGTKVIFTHSTDEIHYESLIGRVLIPFQVVVPSSLSEKKFKINSAHSSFFTPSGEAVIISGGWALPIANFKGIALGESSGDGALFIRTGPGLCCKWYGLKGENVHLSSAIVFSEHDTLVFASSDATSFGGFSRMRLWKRKTNSHKSYSEIILKYQKPFKIQFFSKLRSSETLLIESIADINTDRPILADGRPIPLNQFHAIETLIQDIDGTRCSVVAQPSQSSLTPKSFSLALSNGLLKITILPDLFLTGKMSTQGDISTGVLNMMFRPLWTIPSLRDPYASNISSSSFTNSYVRSNNTENVGWLVSSVQWSSPEAPSLSISLISFQESKLFQIC